MTLSARLSVNVAPGEVAMAKPFSELEVRTYAKMWAWNVQRAPNMYELELRLPYWLFQAAYMDDAQRLDISLNYTSDHGLQLTNRQSLPIAELIKRSNERGSALLMLDELMICMFMEAKLRPPVTPHRSVRVTCDTKS